MKIFRIRCGKVEKIIPAKDRFEAFKKFALSVEEDEIPKLSALMVSIEGNEKYPITSPSLLYLAGKIDLNSAIETIMLVTGCTRDEAIQILHYKLDKVLDWWEG